MFGIFHKEEALSLLALMLLWLQAILWIKQKNIHVHLGYHPALFVLLERTTFTVEHCTAHTYDHPCFCTNTDKLPVN